MASLGPFFKVEKIRTVVLNTNLQHGLDLACVRRFQKNVGYVTLKRLSQVSGIHIPCSSH